jgi:hypothetical protein
MARMQLVEREVNILVVKIKHQSGNIIFLLLLIRE